MEKAIESFINQCDDLMIAEESDTANKLAALAITGMVIGLVVSEVRDHIRNKKNNEDRKNIKLSKMDKKSLKMPKDELELHIKALYKLCNENTEKQIPKLKLSMDKKYHIIFRNGMDNRLYGDEFSIIFLTWPGHIQDELPGYNTKNDDDEDSKFNIIFNKYDQKYDHCLNFISSQCRTIISEYCKQMQISPHVFDVDTGDGDEGTVCIKYNGKIVK